jgi:hypothetical protein
MSNKSLDEMVENTCVDIENLFHANAPAWLAELHDDICCLYVFLSEGNEHSERSEMGVLEPLDRCQRALFYGELLITTRPRELEHTTFGVN